MDKSKTLQVRLTPEMMAYLQEKSEKEGSWVSDYVRGLIEKDMNTSRNQKARKTYAI